MYLAAAPWVTGAPRRMFALCEILRAHGMTVAVAADSADEVVHEATRRGFEVVIVPREEILSRRNKALLRAGAFAFPRLALALVKQNWRFVAAVRAWRPDVIWTRGAKGVAFAGPASVITRRPLIWDVAMELPSAGRVRILHRLGFAVAAAVVCQYGRAASAIFGERLAATYAHKTHALIPGIELSRLREARAKRLARAKDETHRVILQIGTVCERKNLRFSIERLASLRRRGFDDVELWVAGPVHEQAYCEAMTQLAESMGVAGQVRLLGWRDDVHELMVAADVLVLPSFDEGVPNAVQEAMSIGLPVVTSDVGGLPEIIDNGETGWALPLADEEAWTEVLATLLSDVWRRQEVGARAAAYADAAFGHERWGAEYARLLERIG